MACFSCAQKAAMRKTAIPVTPTIPVVCGQNELKIDELISKIKCIINIERTPKLNSYLGILLSMKNVQDFCRYDINEIENFTINYAQC
jgi:hypothetical protein